MSRLLLPLLALLAVLGLYAWDLEQRRGRAEETARQAAEQRDRLAQQTTTLADALARERAAQAGLRTTQDDLRTALARRLRQIEDLTHENQQLRDWAARPLPAAARRLRERPALAGADAYRDWLSGRGAVPPAGDGAGP